MLPLYILRQNYGPVAGLLLNRQSRKTIKKNYSKLVTEPQNNNYLQAPFRCTEYLLLAIMISQTTKNVP